MVGLLLGIEFMLPMSSQLSVLGTHHPIPVTRFCIRAVLLGMQLGLVSQGGFVTATYGKNAKNIHKVSL